MDQRLAVLAQRISLAESTQANRTKLAIRHVKIWFVAVASAIVAIAQFAQFPAAGPTVWQMLGISSSIIVAAGAVIIMWLEEDAGDKLRLAREALEAAREVDDNVSGLVDVTLMASRAVNLYNVVMSMRRLIEAAALRDDTNAVSLVEQLLDTAGQNLRVALGFDQRDTWSICVYRPDLDAARDRPKLVCVAHDRSTKCDINAGRKWTIDDSIGGLAFKTRREVIVPDRKSIGIGNVFDGGPEWRPSDVERYRSVAAVPILVGTELEPWGVVVATNNNPEHFELGESPGYRPTEAVRATARMMELAIASTLRVGGAEKSVVLGLDQP